MTMEASKIFLYNLKLLNQWSEDDLKIYFIRKLIHDSFVIFVTRVV